MVEALLALAVLAAQPEPAPPHSEKPPHSRRAMPDMAIVPSLGLGGFTGEDGHDRSIGGAHLWAGVLVHPAPNEFGPFMGLGGSFDAVTARRGSTRFAETWYGTAELRYGVAWLLSRRWEDAMVPVLAVYAIGGWRPEHGSSGLYRAGGGIASPAVLAIAGKSCIPVPSMIEVVVDSPEGSFDGRDSRTSFRAGWQF